MASRFEELPDCLVSEIFGKTNCAKSLVRCSTLSKKYEPLIVNVNVQSLFIPVPIRERFLNKAVQSVPPPRRRSVQEGVVWLFTKSPFSVFMKLTGMVRNFLAVIRRFKKNPTPLPPPLPNILVHWDYRNIILLGRSSLTHVVGAYMNTVKQSTILPKLAPPQCLELVLSFPDSTHPNMALIKWKGFCHSERDFYFVMLIRENIREISDDDFAFSNYYPYRYRGACIYFKNFLLMSRQAKMGNWFSSVQDIAISYTRNSLIAMCEEIITNAFPVVENRRRGRRWVQNVVRFPERNVELNGVHLVIIRGEDCVIDDMMIIQQAFKEDQLLCEAATRIYDSMDPIEFRFYL